MVQRLQRGFLIHVADIQDKTQASHAIQQSVAIGCQRSRLTRPATEARAGPGWANEPDAALPPILELRWLADAFGALHEQYQPYAMISVAVTLPMAKHLLQGGARLNQLE